MRRRDFLEKLLLSAGYLIFVGSKIFALSSSKTSGISWKQAFEKSLKKDSWFLPFLGTNEEILKASRVSVRGKIPLELKGRFYRNGPAQNEVGDLRYHHWFDGDGLLQSFYIDGKNVSHLARMVRTKKYQLEQKSGVAMFNTFGTHVSDEPVTGVDDLSVANISVLSNAGKIFALWEGGSAYEMNPKTLKTIGIKTWSEESEGFPFSAHPKTEKDGTVWNIGYAPYANSIFFYKISPKGRLEQFSFLETDAGYMVHDFLLSSRHIIVPLYPLIWKADADTGGAFLDQFEWKPNRNTQVLVVDKNNLKKYQKMELPAQWVFHYGNAWEDSDGVISYNACRYPNADIMLKGFRDVMRGEQISGNTSKQYLVRIDPKKKKITEEALDSSIVEFPRVYPRMAGQKNRFVVLAKQKNDYNYFNTVHLFDLKTGKTKEYTYSPDTVMEEHILVPNPRSNREEDSFILGTTIRYKEEVTELNIFRTSQLEKGPVAVARLPYLVPLGLHGIFVPEV